MATATAVSVNRVSSHVRNLPPWKLAKIATRMLAERSDLYDDWNPQQVMFEKRIISTPPNGMPRRRKR